MAMKFVSNMNDYQGYSERTYDGYKKTSEYIPMPDGCRLAVDIYRPTKGGKLHEEPLPIIWCATQYRRAMYKEDGSITDLKESAELWFTPAAAEILYYGYIVAAVDVRGSGASFGHGCAQTPTLQELYDVFECNEWLAARPYCTHETGMFGMSYLGSCQWMGAMMGAPSLKCMIPVSSPWDNPYLRINGIDNVRWTTGVDDGLYDKNVLHPSPKVDEDEDGSLLAAAVEEHKGNPHTQTLRETGKYFDDTLPYYNSKVYFETYYGNFYQNVNNLGVAVYLIEGIRDFLVTDSFDWFNNLTTPKRLTVGPWDHSSLKAEPFGKHGFNYLTEMLRWYDYWLKGIDNGIMDEPDIRMYNYGAEEWKFFHAEKFPVAGTEYSEFYAQGLNSGTVASRNDGSLTTRFPSRPDGETSYTIDYSCSKDGYLDRNFYNVENPILDYTTFDEKGITFTSPAFAADTVMQGFPILRLWFSANAESVDFYAYLQEIDENGVATNMTEGMLRSNFRGTITPAFDHMGLPLHRNARGDDKPLPLNKPVFMEFNMSVLSWTIKQGHRVRLTINNSDRLNFGTPELDPAPQITIYHNSEYPTSIALPVLHA